ncbi:hypothetical protein BG20_I0840 [Candidatus Nitrosarchaeum limnium BG20]|uniref:Uncharacterized protein n=1 Tax=Candidatus Nitrosarchaeum limnium BG20 TaxID=859192 RepID=S2ELL9_9ARCH|nr:hypothetical protein BG20_I0840 [Candidatus Nitrosarchaeum limnium BG20]
MNIRPNTPIFSFFARNKIIPNTKVIKPREAIHPSANISLDSIRKGIKIAINDTATIKNSSLDAKVLFLFDKVMT